MCNRRVLHMNAGAGMTGSRAASGRVRVGLTLPSFQSEPEKVLAVARAAEDAGLDGVFQIGRAHV